MKKYKVNLIYFKYSGKWYATSEYYTEKNNMLSIWDEVEEMKNKNILPGVTYNDFIILVDVESDFGFSKLLIDKKYMRNYLEVSQIFEI